MIRLIFWLLWPTFPENPKDAEFNIDGLEVYGIERRDGETLISYFNSKGKSREFYVTCPLSTHRRMLAQFRQKLELQQSAKAAK